MSLERSHESLNQLLPWYVNATLSPEEHDAVAEHLKACTVCEKELEWLRTTSAAMADLDEEIPSPNMSFAKTLAAVEAFESSKPDRWLARLWGEIWNPPAARLVFAAQFALIIGLAFFLFRNTPEGQFTTLSGPTATSGGARLTISFDPNATVTQVGQILTGVSGNVVSGPSASGIYVVELRVAPEKDAEVQAVIDKLRMNAAIRFVERQP